MLGVAFPLLPESLWLGACAYAAATEFLDGYLSRLWDIESQAGRLLDPVADKVFVLTVLGTLVATGRIELFELALIGVRDVVVGLGCISLFITGRRDEIERCRARPIGKLTTWFQFAFLLAVLITGDSTAWLLYPTTAMSVAAATDYLVHYFGEIRGD
jgi:phosphatidylglycerophosphate synthase